MGLVVVVVVVVVVVGGAKGWLTGSFRLDGRSIRRGREEVHLCQRDVWLWCDCSADYVCVCACV